MKSFMYVLNFHLEICSCLQPALSLFFNNFKLLMSKPSSSLLRNLIIHLPTSKCSPELRENKTKQNVISQTTTSTHNIALLLNNI